MVLWYCMVMSCIDTAEVILSDWSDTGDGTTEIWKSVVALDTYNIHVVDRHRLKSF